MDAGDGPFLLILFIGAVIVLVDGQLIFRNGPPYLTRVDRGPRRAGQVSGMVAVLFHLVMLGLVALVASLGWRGAPTLPTLIARIGVLLLLTAVGHTATIAALSRLREQRVTAELSPAGMRLTHRGEMRAADGGAETDLAEMETSRKGVGRAQAREQAGVSGLAPEDPRQDPLARTPRAARGSAQRPPR